MKRTRARTIDPWDRFGAWFLAAIALTAILTFQDYGVTYDEPKQHAYGGMLWRFYMSAFEDRGFLAFHDLWLYGGIFELVVWPLHKLSPFGIFETRHLFGGLVGVIGLAGAWRMGRLLGGGAGGAFSLILLALTPVYYGHMFNNPKDIPFAAGYIWSVFLLLKLCTQEGRGRWRTLIAFGIAAGITAAVRVGGLVVILYLPVALAIAHMWNERRPRPSTGWSGPLFRGAFEVAAVAAIAYAIMSVFWPYALLRPVGGVAEALSLFSRFNWTGGVLFAGKVYDSGHLPLDYVPRLLAIKVPEIVPLLLAAGVVLGILKWGRTGRSERRRASRNLALVLMSVVAPVAYVMAGESVLYNGIRHFLFVIPPLVCLAGWSGSGVLGMAGGMNRWGKTALAAVLAGYVTVHIAVLAHLHPHQYVYFNAFTGGLPGAFNNYETDYWGNSCAELTRAFVAKLLDENGGVPKACRVIIGAPFDSVRYYLPEWCTPVDFKEPADFCLTLLNSSCLIPPGPVYTIVQRFGVPLAVVKDLRSRRP